MTESQQKKKEDIATITYTRPCTEEELERGWRNVEPIGLNVQISCIKKNKKDNFLKTSSEFLCGPENIFHKLNNFQYNNDTYYLYKTQPSSKFFWAYKKDDNLQHFYQYGILFPGSCEDTLFANSTTPFLKFTGYKSRAEKNGISYKIENPHNGTIMDYTAYDIPVLNKQCIVCLTNVQDPNATTLYYGEIQALGCDKQYLLENSNNAKLPNFLEKYKQALYLVPILSIAGLTAIFASNFYASRAAFEVIKTTYEKFFTDSALKIALQSSEIENLKYKFIQESAPNFLKRSFFGINKEESLKNFAKFANNEQLIAFGSIVTDYLNNQMKLKFLTAIQLKPTYFPIHLFKNGINLLNKIIGFIDKLFHFPGANAEELNCSKVESTNLSDEYEETELSGEDNTEIYIDNLC